MKSDEGMVHTILGGSWLFVYDVVTPVVEGEIMWHKRVELLMMMITKVKRGGGEGVDGLQK